MDQKHWLYHLQNDFNDLDNDDQKSVYDAYWDLVYRDIFFVTHDHELTKDVVQESFIKVIERAPLLPDTKHLKAWIIRIARNLVYDLYRKNKKHHLLSEPQVVVRMEDQLQIHSVAKQVEEKIRNEILYEALNELKANYHQVLFMYYFEEKSYKEIAKELDTTEQALAQTMARARKNLYNYFSIRWVDPGE